MIILDRGLLKVHLVIHTTPKQYPQGQIIKLLLFNVISKHDPQHKDRIVELLNAADLHTLSFKAVRSQIEKEFTAKLGKHIIFKK
jgi:hypothetical protein